MCMWLHILLSATCFNCAFFFPHYCAWTIIFFLPVLMPVFFNKHSFRWGLIWGCVTYGVYFLWLLHLLRTHSQAVLPLALFVYSISVIYFALTSGCWFWVTSNFLKLIQCFESHMVYISALLLTTLSYFIVLDRWILTPLGRVEGFPFLNPLIPLAQYAWFVKLCTCVCAVLYGAPVHQQNFLDVVDIVYLEPLLNKKKGEDKPWALSPRGVGQAMFHQLKDLNLEQYHDKPIIIVAPESTYRFPLNWYPEMIDLWDAVLPQNAHLMFGSHRGDRMTGNIYQAVYWINMGRIINFYVKKHRIPFVEKIPKYWRSLQWMSDLFLKDLVEFMPGKNSRYNKIFCVTPTLCVVPTMCSEFFFARSIDEFQRYKKIKNKTVAIFFFVNDSWFADYFSYVLELFTRLKSAVIGLPVVYITHEKVEVIGA